MKCHLLIAALALSVTSAKITVAEEPARPNILVFYVDDMGWGSIGPNAQAARKANGLPSVRTPNLDQLAAEGINFTRGYGCHVCSPARSSLQTGFHQGHTFADRNDPNNARKAIRADDLSIGSVLSKAGYATGYWGKWGYGGSADQANPVIENIQTLPTSHGYDFVLAELHHVRAHTFFQPTLWSAPAAAGSVGGLQLIPNSMAGYRNNKSYPNTPALQNHDDYPRTAYCDDCYAFAALDFVRAQGQNYNQSKQPFLGILAVQIPHAPFDEVATLPEWDKAYADDPHFVSLDDQTRQWAAMVTRIDAHFGNILNALNDPDNDGDTSDSVADNTLVIFTSDNGGPKGKNNDELDANGGLSGYKNSIQEGGIRVPLVMRWPAKITAESQLKAGTNCDRVVDVTDWLPTFAELAGAPAPVGIDGVSIAPTLLGSGHQRDRKFIIHEAGNGQSIIHKNFKLVQSKKSTYKLYDLAADPAEANDIVADHPQMVGELAAFLMGERVNEPKGFANTYHDWIGQHDANTSSANNWSDYHYSNAGITYTTDDGVPQSSWIARIENATDMPQVANVDRDLDVLGIEVRGNDAIQTVVLGPQINLTGRNEIRLGPNSILKVNKGTVSSLRWVDIAQGGMIAGNGIVDATLYNDGNILVGGSDAATLLINADYHQSSDAGLQLTINDAEKPPFQVSGQATLGGVLSIIRPDDFSPIPGKPFTVLRARRISGSFQNENDEVLVRDGSRFAIGYTDSSVTLTLK
ncbi:MAG: sulfatase-like hydrolase/transferase [Pirellulaceae bacterium]